MYSICHFSYSYLSKRLIIRKFISIYDLAKPVQITAPKSWIWHKSKKYQKVMVKTKPYHYPEGNESKKLTDKHKGQSPKTKRYRGKKTQTKT